MTRALFVGDGPRDEATIPRFVENVLARTIAYEFRSWKSIHIRGGGYRKKLLYAFRIVRDGDNDALVATVDADKHPARRCLTELRNGRESDRKEQPLIPCALGEARPHGEAWLLDDRVAVCDALKIRRETKIPAVRKTKDPKKTLNQLIEASPRAHDNVPDVLGDIAAQLDPDRCKHANETGFSAFLEEIESELRQ